ncbi:MAG: nucleotidyltransferase domain-containing protein [Nitrospira sp. CG24B]|nr:MAG: nucleotidyltransferase domain-containing protein [Nitrospira sp. CG24B]TKB59803.1 MAG: nucleotidyltransferase domain-containing protein [Nitrospira sp.]
MKTALYTIRPEQREDVLAKLRVELAKVSGLRFAYVYGSVLESDRVHDVDVGVYLDVPMVAQQMNMMDALLVTLSAAVGFPVDIRVLNEAPLPFLYHVLRGRLLLCRDETFLTDMLEDVARRYLDLAPFLCNGTKDAFAA